MKITVECKWAEAGPVRLVDGMLQMPVLPEDAGVYQWVFRHGDRERRYVGEAASLRGRFQQYRTPGRRQSTNLRMNDRARRVLEAGGTVVVLTTTDVTVVRGVRRSELDLSSKHARCLVENAALVDLLASAGEIINNRGNGELRNDPVLG